MRKIVKSQMKMNSFDEINPQDDVVKIGYYVIIISIQTEVLRL